MNKKMDIAMSVFSVAVALQFITKNTNILSVPVALLCLAWIGKVVYVKTKG